MESLLSNGDKSGLEPRFAFQNFVVCSVRTARRCGQLSQFKAIMVKKTGTFTISSRKKALKPNYR